jgi:hypothetical protein
VAGVSALPNRLYFSAIGDADTWPANNFIDVVTNDGDPITAIQPLGDALIIFKKHQIYALEGASESSFFLRRISPEYGCSGNRAMATNGDLIAFLDSHGPRIVLMDSSYGFVDISTEKIPNLMAGLNKAKHNLSVATFHQNMFIFNVANGSATTNDYRLVYDIDRKAWCPKWTGGFSCELIYDSGTALSYYSGNPTAGTVYLQEGDDKDDTTAITSKMRTKDYDMGLPFNPKKFRKVWLGAQFGGTTSTRRLTVRSYADKTGVGSTSFDFGASTAALVGTAVVGTAVLTDNTVPVKARERLGAKGKTLGFEIENTTTDQQVTIHSLEWTTKTKPVR